MAEIRWTAEAQRWLEDIFEYIYSDNPQAAIQTVNGIFERTQVLANFPEMGHRYRVSSRHVRILLYGHYRIAYLINDTKTSTCWAFFTVRSISAGINCDDILMRAWSILLPLSGTECDDLREPIAVCSNARDEEMKQSKFPAGWDEQRVRRVLEHYEQRTDEQSVAEDEAAFEDATQTIIAVPRDLVPTIREVIAKHKRSQRA